VNLTTLSKLPEGTLIMTGTFSINHHPVIILFDSGATHSFVSAKYGTKIGLDIYPTNGDYKITTPGGKILSNQICGWSIDENGLASVRPRRNGCSFRYELDDPAPCVLRYLFSNYGDRFT
jgi:hypothetical protein